MRRDDSHGCKAPKWKDLSGDLLGRIVREYVSERAENEDRYLRFYAIQTSLEAAITKAALAELPSGKRFSHQRRIPSAVLEQARDALLKLNFEEVKCFDDLYLLCEATLQPIKGVGELMIYDTVHRLSAFFSLQPEHVYLHAGVRAGAKALGLDHRKDKLSQSELPKAFQKLRPDQVEDCLCIYKKELREWGTQKY